MELEDIITKLKTMHMPEQDSSYVDQDSYCIGYCDGYNAATAKALAMLEELTENNQEVQKGGREKSGDKI